MKRKFDQSKPLTKNFLTDSELRSIIYKELAFASVNDLESLKKELIEDYIPSAQQKISNVKTVFEETFQPKSLYSSHYILERFVSAPITDTVICQAIFQEGSHVGKEHVEDVKKIFAHGRELGEEYTKLTDELKLLQKLYKVIDEKITNKNFYKKAFENSALWNNYLRQRFNQVKLQDGNTRSNKPQFIAIPTAGRGDCLLNAALGEVTGNYCESEFIKLQREVMANAVLDANKNEIIFKYIKKGIKQTIMEGLENKPGNRFEDDKLPALQRLKDRYAQNLSDWNLACENAWSEFSKVLSKSHLVMGYITKNYLGDQQDDLKIKFQSCLNSDDTSVAMEQKIKASGLQAAYHQYNSKTDPTNNIFDWELEITPSVLNEYALLIGTCGKELYYVEAGILAHVFDRHISCYTKGKNGEYILAAEYNPEAATKVKIVHNGINHYERLVENNQNNNSNTLQSVLRNEESIRFIPKLESVNAKDFLLSSNTKQTNTNADLDAKQQEINNYYNEQMKKKSQPSQNTSTQTWNDEFLYPSDIEEEFSSDDDVTNSSVLKR